MATPFKDPATLPAHVDEAVQSVARLHRDHHESATRFQKMVDLATHGIGRPSVVIGFSVAVVGWIVGNLALIHFDQPPIDEPPFLWLTAVTGLLSLYVVVLILITQLAEDRLAQLREQLTLELTLLNEQKIAKVITLLEELRADLPIAANRVDAEADAMGRSVDTQAIVEAIKNA